MLIQWDISIIYYTNISHRDIMGIYDSWGSGPGRQLWEFAGSADCPWEDHPDRGCGTVSTILICWDYYSQYMEK